MWTFAGRCIAVLGGGATGGRTRRGPEGRCCSEKRQLCEMFLCIKGIGFCGSEMMMSSPKLMGATRCRIAAAATAREGVTQGCRRSQHHVSSPRTGLSRSRRVSLRCSSRSDTGETTGERNGDVHIRKLKVLCLCVLTPHARQMHCATRMH
jgi:hypothetical protein